jgi:hypothetical protein
MSDLDVQNINSKTGNAAISIADDGTTTVTTFTSTGIDDNATSTKLTVADTSITTGGIDQLIVAHSTDGGGIRIDSTNSTNTGSLRFGDDLDNYIGALEYSHTDNAMSMYVNNATRMTINSSGNVGIGNTNPSHKLEVSGPGTILARLSATDSAQAYMGFSNSTTGGGTYADGIIVGLDSDESAVFYNFEATPMRFGTSGIERLRIDSSGNLLVGKTSVSAGFSHQFQSTSGLVTLSAYRPSSATSSSIMVFNSDVGTTNSTQCIVKMDGDLENTNNSYGALSDERLKSNIVDASSQIDDIMAVQVRSYTLNKTGDTHIGVVAQELEASGMSGLVKTDDEGMKSVKYSILYVKAIKALQEAVTRIETLEAEVAALKGAN